MIIDANEETFDEAVSKGVAIVDFWATWCGPCRIQGAILEEKVAPALPDVAIVKVDIDNNPGLAAKFSIMSIPALRIFKDGTLVKSFDGVTKPDEIASAVANA